MKLKESIYVIGEGETEQYYFKHLKNLKLYNCKVRPRLFSKGNNIYNFLEKRIKELIAADVTVICVFDVDTAKKDKKEKDKFQSFVRKHKKNKSVIICDSLPSIEFWFLLHFKNTNKHFDNYNQLRDELRKDIPDYGKTEKYLKNDKWVNVLVSKQDSAVKNAKRLNQKGEGSYSNVYKAIERLEETIPNK